MEPTLGLSLSTGICKQRPVNLHFNQNHVCWKAPYILVQVCFRKLITDFTIFENRLSIFFLSFLVLIISWSHLSFFFLSISCLITFWKPFGISSIMICWLSNGEGPLGGGSALQTVCCCGGGGRLRNKKKWQGGGSTKKWWVYQKIAQPGPLLLLLLLQINLIILSILLLDIYITNRAGTSTRVPEVRVG